MKKTILVLVLVTLIFTLFGCSSKGGVTTEGDFNDNAGTVEKPGKPNENNPDIDITDISERKLIKTAELIVQTKQFDDFLTKINSEVISRGGYVELSNIHGNGYNSASMRSATFVFRVPYDKLDDFLSVVSQIGKVTSSSQTVNDVTMKYVDTESHLKALRTEESGLLKLLEDAKNLQDIISIQDRLTQVRYSIESLESQLRKYDSLISYSTVNMTINEVERESEIVANDSVWKKISVNLSDGFYDVWEFLKDAFVVAVSAIPYLLIVAVPLGIALIIIFIIKKRKK
ncbi:MAG: DUF4349 domain-containing protein [Clostridia bacterium]